MTLYNIRKTPQEEAAAAQPLRFCSRPFKHLEVAARGEVFMCCPGWLPTSLGNVRDHSLRDLWNNEIAQDIRASMLDGSLRHCTGCQHARIVNGPVHPINEVPFEDWPYLQAASTTVPAPMYLNLSYDRSCNLSCPSCRTKVIVATPRGNRDAPDQVGIQGPLDTEQNYEDLLEIQVHALKDGFLADIENLWVTGSGDPFASRLYRDLLRTLDVAKYPNLKIRLHTNGLLLKSGWQELPKAVQDRVKMIEISIDASTPATYVENRRGGDFARLLENLAFVRELRERGPVTFFRMSFVVQANNWREMKAFVDLSAEYKADEANFSSLVNWGTYTDEDFRARAIQLPDHPEHEMFLSELEDPKFQVRRVLLADFGQPATKDSPPMKFVILDSTAIVDTGPGSAAYFSRPVIDHLLLQGYQVEVMTAFNREACAAADVVWSEWCNEVAFEAAASGVCKRLVIRMRGYDVWFPLDKMEWKNVDALVYESETLKTLAAEKFPLIESKVKTWVIPAGIDLTKFAWKQRGPGNVFALVARSTSDKGYQLAMEWARQNPQNVLQVTLALAETNPRLVRYLEHTAPSNVILNGTVDTATWLNDIDANFLLLPSIWETLSYTVAEAMALGIKPLIHDFPGATTNWPGRLVWRDFKDLDRVIHCEYGYESKDYREYVERHLDGAEQSKKFTALLLGLHHSTNDRVQVKPTQPPTVHQVHATFQQALIGGDLDKAENVASLLATNAPADVAAGVAIQLAGVFYSKNDFDKARFWALSSMVGGPRTDAMGLLGEIAAEDSPETAHDWYQLACAVPETRSRVKLGEVVEGRYERLAEIKTALDPKLPPGKSPPKYVVVVPVRNAEKWIRRCLESINSQICVDLSCVVVDDASTDDTAKKIQAFISGPLNHEFTLLRNVTRFGSLNNINRALNHTKGDPEDVCVVVDGDDWLANPGALVDVEKAYQAGAWMTYGSWRDTSGKLTWMDAYPAKVAREGLHRQVSWAGSHLKTFKRFLFDEIHLDDFKDDAGEWFTIGGDVALMIPMLEMARERAVHIPNILYGYNVETQDNDHKLDPMGQTRVRDLVFSREPYQRFEK